MRALLITWWTRVRNSYWFVPSLMAISAIILSFVTTGIDSVVGSEWPQNISWVYANKPAGARAVLSTVAGSMITVAGVTFSMTILSISYTTSQVGPRLLGNFMRDRGNQVTLGVFISTFLYCLMVLRTVRNGDTPPPGGAADGVELVTAFVPHVAVIVGVLLAIASVGVLIYFIHHVPESIHVSNIIAGVGRDLQKQIDSRFPTRIGSAPDDTSANPAEPNLPESFYITAAKVCSTGSGYIEYLDDDTLMEIAGDHDLVIRLRFRPGDFVTEGDALLLASPATRVDDDVEDKLQATFVTGVQRTVTQNLSFVVNQLVEVAMRALSPGVNDPFTAMNCMDWLQSSLGALASRQMPDAHRLDKDGALRVVAQPETFGSFVDLACDQLRPYVAADRNAAVHMIEMLAKIAIKCPRQADRRLLVRHAGALRRECLTRLDDRRGRALITDRYRSMIHLLRDPAYRARVMETGDWIGGRG